jgi:hypothetical protein
MKILGWCSRSTIHGDEEWQCYNLQVELPNIWCGRSTVLGMKSGDVADQMSHAGEDLPISRTPPF